MKNKIPPPLITLICAVLIYSVNSFVVEGRFEVPDIVRMVSAGLLVVLGGIPMFMGITAFSRANDNKPTATRGGQ